MWGTLNDERMGLSFTLQLLLGLARAVTLGSMSRRTQGHILLSHLRLPQPGGPGPHIYISQEQGGPVIPPGTKFPFVNPYNSQGYGGGILTKAKFKVTLRPTISRQVRLGQAPIWHPQPIFFSP
jgi:hypothetical protein